MFLQLFIEEQRRIQTRSTYLQKFNCISAYKLIDEVVFLIYLEHAKYRRYFHLLKPLQQEIFAMTATSVKKIQEVGRQGFSYCFI